MIVLAGLVATVLLLASLWASSKRRQWQLASKMPGPRGLPLLGNSLSFMGSAEETFNILRKWASTYGPTMRVWIGPRLYVVLSDPNDIQLVIGDQKTLNRDSMAAAAVSTFYGDGLLSSRDETWRRHRKLVTPAFYVKVLESYVGIFARKAEILAEKIEVLADGRTTDISHQLCLCSLDAICETVIGTDMDILNNGSSEFASAVNESTALIHNRAARPWLLLDWLYPWTSEGERAKKVIRNINKFSEEIIASRLASYRKGDSIKNSVSDKKVASFLDLLIETSARDEQSLTAAEIRDEVSTMAAAGMDTTSITLAHTLVLLGMHPEYQDQIDDELADIFQGDSTRTPTPEDVHKMNVLEYVIKETLRLFPTVTVMPREITQEVEISNGYVLPAGCSAYAVNFMTHRNPDYFVDPERFWPERWTQENSVHRHPFAFVPFGAGPRNCIGQKYAMLAMKTILSTLLRRFRFECDCYTMNDLLRLEISSSLRSADGYRLQMYRKDKV